MCNFAGHNHDNGSTITIPQQENTIFPSLSRPVYLTLTLWVYTGNLSSMTSELQQLASQAPAAQDSAGACIACYYS